MKRCPDCKRDYYDDSLLYCLDDGNRLLEGPAGINSIDSSSQSGEPALLLTPSTVAQDDYRTKKINIRNIQGEDHSNAIAVLSFANMSGDSDAEYLSDGIAEELLNVLSRVQGLRVAGRTSAFSFKGKQTTFEEIGRQLNVSSVLEGSVRMSGKRVRVAVQLVNVADGYHRWSQTYDRTMDDIFAIQDDIANSVVEELRSRLINNSPDSAGNAAAVSEIANALRGRAEDAEAYRLMMVGRHLAERRTSGDLGKSVEYFERSLKIDPNNPQCLVELGFVELLRAGLGFTEYSDGYRKGRACAEKALLLNPDFASAHALLSRLKGNHAMDFVGADDSINRALCLEPDNLFVIMSAATIFRNSGRINESLELSRTAALLDPLNATALIQAGQTAYFAGLLDEAEAAARRAIEISPQGVYRHALLALILSATGRLDEARAEAANEAGEEWKLWIMAIIECVAGNTAEAQRALDSLRAEWGDECAFQIAEVCAVMGDRDNAFKWLDIAASTDPGINHILISPMLRNLPEDPRWQPLLRKIGIPDDYAANSESVK